MKTTDIESWRAFGLKGLFSALRLMIQASFLRNTTWQPPFWKTALIVAHVCFFVRHASLNKGSGNKDHDNWAICKGQILLQNLSLTEHSRKICEILRHFPILLTTFMAKKLRIIFSSKLFFYVILANKKFWIWVTMGWKAWNLQPLQKEIEPLSVLPGIKLDRWICLN